MTIPLIVCATLTYERLQEVGACPQQMALFQHKYGASVIVTVEAARAVAGAFDWGWAGRLLDPQALAAYDVACIPALVEFRVWRMRAGDARATLGGYLAALTLAEAAYNAARAPLWALAFIDSESRK